MIWTEAFRPKNLDQVAGQDNIVNFFKNLGKIDVSEWSHFIFHGPPGTGKTTMAWAIANHYNMDIIEINASHYRKVEDMETTIMSIVRQMPEKGKKKIIFLDEADGLGTHSQWMLRRYMEEYSNVNVFIFDCNYSAKIIPAIHDRCIDFQFHGLDAEAMKTIAVNICKKSNHELPPPSDLQSLIESSGGSARSFTNNLFSYIVGGIVPEQHFDAVRYLNYIKKNDIENAKKLITNVTYNELLKQVIEVLLKLMKLDSKDKFQDMICKLGDYLLLSQSPDENLGKIVVTLQLKKYFNGGT